MPQPTEQQVLAQQPNPSPNEISKKRLFETDREKLRLRLEDRQKQIDEERTKAARERRAYRLKGGLTKGLHENLRACNPLQLKTVRKLITKYEKDHRMPPSLRDCREKQTVEVLTYADVYNRRYTLELRRSSRSRGKVYVNGPYAVAHHRDGAIIRHAYIGNKKLSTRLPRKVWPVFRPFMTSSETVARIEKHNKAWAERNDEE
jgi:hypothetical protein